MVDARQLEATIWAIADGRGSDDDLAVLHSDPRASLLVLDRLIDLMPDVTDELRDHGYLCAKLGAPRAAIEHLQRYLGVLPNAGDVVEVRKFLAKLEQESARGN